jgi:hypothetical protein
MVITPAMLKISRLKHLEGLQEHHPVLHYAFSLAVQDTTNNCIDFIHKKSDHVSLDRNNEA